MVEFLDSDAFLGPLGDAAMHGENAIFRGRIEVGSRNVRCYIKPFAATIRSPSGVSLTNNSVIGEALGYTLAKASGLAVADTAGVIILRSYQIPENVLRKLLSQPSGSAPPAEYVAWFSEDMKHPALLAECPSDAPELMQIRNRSRVAADLADNKAIPAVVSFDEWTENNDRHLGNLLGGPSGGLILIDHGRLFRTPSWTPASLNLDPLVARNALQELIDGIVPSWSTRTPIRSARKLAYKAFSVAWKADGRRKAESVLTEFLPPSEVTQVLEFLAARLEPSHYMPKVGLML
jgi:hypothetical protein